MRKFLSKTKPSSYHRAESHRIQTRVFFVLVVCIVLFFGRGVIGSVASWVAMPVLGVKHYLASSTDTIPVYVRERTELLKQIQSLEQDIAGQQGIQVTLAYLERENEELRSLLGATETPTILAGVVARPPLSPYDTLVIDRGSNDGVVEKAPVYYGAGMALGHIETVYANHSLVSLLSSPEVESTVYVFGANIFATAYGEGGGTIRISIPQGITVSVGDPVILPSLEDGVVGVVREVQSIPSEPEQHVYVSLDTPLQSIRSVRVSTESHSPISFEDARNHVEGMRDTLFILPVPFEEMASTSSSTLVSPEEVQ